MNNKLQKIDMFLKTQSELDKYINEIENTQISYSSKLEDKILSKANKMKSVYYFNIFKMVACMTVALILCQTDYIKNTNLNQRENIKHEIVQKDNFINDKVNEISNFFMSPINLEKEENK